MNLQSSVLWSAADMRTLALPLLLLSLGLHGCAQMPDYSNVEAEDAKDAARYTLFETETYAGRGERSWADMQPNMNIIRINDKKVGDIPFSTYYYKTDSPERALLVPGKYKVELEYQIPGKFMLKELDFEGKAGQKLIARSQYIGLNRVEIWIEDAATGDVISGHKSD